MFSKKRVAGSMEKLFIQNRKGQKISVLLDIVPQQKGLAFVMHGLGGFKKQPHIQTVAEAFLAHGISVVRFDTTNTYGESEGNYEDATVTNYYADLEDVILWAESQTWYEEPFFLAGHSLGGICTALYTEKFPKRVKALAPIATAVSGQLMLAAEPKERVAEWDKTGWKISPSVSKPGVMKKLNWKQFVADSLQYNLISQVGALTMPVLLVVGSEDYGTPPAHQQILYDALPGKNKEFHIIKGAPHTFREPGHLGELGKIVDNWLGKIC